MSRLLESGLGAAFCRAGPGESEVTAMRSESETPQQDNPFTIPVASRMRRLPPYLFGKINKLKYEKRVAGIDVIDLGHDLASGERARRDRVCDAVAAQRVVGISREHGDFRVDRRAELLKDAFQDGLVAEVHPAVGTGDANPQRPS